MRLIEAANGIELLVDTGCHASS